MDQTRGLLAIFLYSKAERVFIIVIIFFFAHLNSSRKNFEYLLIN